MNSRFTLSLQAKKSFKSRPSSSRSPYLREKKTEPSNQKPVIIKMNVATNFQDVFMCVGKNIVSIGQLNLTNEIRRLLLQKNQICDFVGFPSLPNLEVLNLSDNPIASLRGFPNFPSLKSIDLSNSPFVLNHLRHYKMAILLCAPGIQIINGEKITKAERQMAKSYLPECVHLTKTGWIPTYPPPQASELNKIRSDLSKHVGETLRSNTKNEIVHLKITKQSTNYKDIIGQQQKSITSLEEKVKDLEKKLRNIMKQNTQ